MAKMTSIWLILSIAASKGWLLKQMDVKNAFLHGDLKEDVYITPPPGLFSTASHDHNCTKGPITLVGLQDGHSADTPLRVNVKYQQNNGYFLYEPSLYQQLVGILNYGTITSPDISFAVQQLESTSLHADNTSAIQIAANPVFLERTKHIEVDCHSIQEAYEDGVISLPHITSDLQTADIFTKALSRQRHLFLVGKLMLLDQPVSI
ncbi:uncharacterized protein LOC110035695 [Phalaenopsis equestris]|uniref:uncharacterized protein LOC110035695 n=1 Tax=Phalaenopsis equestris TaxID=78828 RepID=UPI0009E45515|nr:uncharacterized protein LOC110035695 [Phalaenopsis equestris]